MAGRQPLPEEERRDRAVYFLKRHEREQVDTLIVRMRQPSQSPNKPIPPQVASLLGQPQTDIQSFLDHARSFAPKKKPEVYVPREDTFYEED